MAIAVSHAMRQHQPFTGFKENNEYWPINEEPPASMHYGDPWLQGSIRAPSGVVLAPALVLCSCPEYVNGTKRSRKKSPSVCKKCKGTRFPIPASDVNKFGTVRCYPTSVPLPVTRPGTLRISSSSRPSVLPQSDPYSTLRSARFSFGETESSKAKSTQKYGSVSRKLTFEGELNQKFGTLTKKPQLENDVPRKYGTVGRKSTEHVANSRKSILENQKFGTVGRKSILECDVNPYELMAAETMKNDKSITMVSGQRIRVHPANRSVPTNSKIHSTSPTSENEYECNNRCKSILKRPTTFVDTDSNERPEKTFPATKSGTHFYLPVNSPRKKVQFLDENKNKHDKHNGFGPPLANAVNEPQNFESKIKEPHPKVSIKLKRSNSERAASNRINVCFNDTMALRSSNIKSVAKELFTQIDPDRLDGTTKNEKILKPARQAPAPPSPNSEEKKQGDAETNFTNEKSSQNSRDKINVLESLPKSPTTNNVKKVTKKEIRFEDNKEIKLTKILSKTSEQNTSSNVVKVDAVDKQENKELAKLVKNVPKISEKSQSSKPKAESSEEENKEVMKLTKHPTKEKEVPNPIPKPHINEETVNKITEDENISFNKPQIQINMIEKSFKTSIKNEPVLHQEEPNQTRNYEEESIKRLDEVLNGNFEKLNVEEVDKGGDKKMHKSLLRLGGVEAEPPSAPPRKRSNNKQPSDINSEQNINKTIVRITNEDSTHKLKIKNEFSTGPIISNEKKTSIMITGNDCYSTVNVNDNIPLYQSSVVVNDATINNIEIKYNKSSTVYITGDSSKPNNKNKEESVNIDGKNDAIELPKLQTQIVEENYDREIKMHTKQGKQYRDRKTKLSGDLLKKLLNDPVEAVRMNLVPHVCGKADVLKRETSNYGLIYDSSINYILNHEEILSKLTLNEFGDRKDTCSEHSSSTQYEIMDQGSDCYTDNSNRSSVTEEELGTRAKFYDLLSDAATVEVSDGDDHHYESINKNVDPIYEEIEIPPPLPTNPPPSSLLDDLQLDKELTTRSIFEGASKYDILSYLVDAKERGLVPEDSYTFNFENTGLVVEEKPSDIYQRMSNLSTVSDSSEDSPLPVSSDEKTYPKSMVVERNDSGIGSETGKYPVAKYRTTEVSSSCEDCEGVIDTSAESDICRKCSKKRSERKEIVTEIVETEEKYSRDLQIILEEFYQPMHVAGLLTAEQLTCIFINVEELLENSQALAERLRDAVEIAYDQADEDLLTVNIGKIFLEAAPMLHAFETYCVRQGAASLLLASLEKDKELLRIFLRVSQMENTVLRRMNLNSFLMVPVQRVTKYPLLLNRLYKVTPQHHETREVLKEAQHKIELHLNHMNSETKDVPSKLWRRISSNSGRRSSAEMDLVNIKLRKIAVDVLEWNHDEAKFALEGKLLFTQPTDNNWRRGRTIKLTPINALLVTNGKSPSLRPERDNLIFSRNSGIRDAALLLVRDKNGRYSLLREPLYLDRCVIAADPAWQSYFEVQELLGKDTFIFKAEDEDQTKVWYRQLQYYAQGMGTWRKRRNALANIMINSMGLRS